MKKLRPPWKKQSLSKQSRRVWPVALALCLVGLSVIGTAGALIKSANAATAFSLFGFSANSTSTPTTTFWLQTMDSCQQAIPGASFDLYGNGLNVPAGPAPGVKPVTVAKTFGNCPLQRGNCSTITTGCVSWAIPIPTSGMVTYKIIETLSPSGYAICTGGSVCPGGPATVTLYIYPSGQIAARVHNIYPDGKSVTWPTTGVPYTGTPTGPAVVHNFGLGTGSCDGDADADDHLTGSPGSHCDDDHDRP